MCKQNFNMAIIISCLKSNTVTYIIKIARGGYEKGNDVSANLLASWDEQEALPDSGLKKNLYMQFGWLLKNVGAWQQNHAEEKENHS